MMRRNSAGVAPTVARLQHLERRIVGAVQQEAVLDDEVREQLVQWIRARRGVNGAVAGAGGADQALERLEPRGVGRDGRALGRSRDVDAEALSQTPHVNAGPQRAQREAVTQGTRALHRPRQPA